jgi:predicted nucleotidyltransferase
MVTAARNREVAHFLVAVRDWADRQPEVHAAAVAGSWAHGDARMSSDLDLVVLCPDPEVYLQTQDWSAALGDLIYLETRPWGPLTELRFALPSMLEIDFGIAPTSWADIDPVDEGTRQVIEDGISILHDPHRLLARLIRACNRP